MQACKWSDFVHAYTYEKGCGFHALADIKLQLQKWAWLMKNVRQHCCTSIPRIPLFHVTCDPIWIILKPGLTRMTQTKRDLDYLTWFQRCCTGSVSLTLGLYLSTFLYSIHSYCLYASYMYI